MTLEWRRDEYLISTDPQRIDIGVVHGFLTNAYWSPGIPVELVERAIKHSLPLGVYRGEDQIGFARVVTDYAAFAYIADVFILEPFRGQGLAKWLVETILSHPELQQLRRWLLMTRDAHGLYRQCGFDTPARPEGFLEIWHPKDYTQT